MKYEDQNMERYYNSLPREVQEFIDSSGADIASLGTLTMIGEHLRNMIAAGETEDMQEIKKAEGARSYDDAGRS